MPRSSATAIVEREQRRRRRVDGHRRRDLVERDAVEQDVHVLDRGDRDARAPDLAARQRVVGVAAHLRGQVERDRQARLPRGQQELVAPVGLLGGAEAGVLAHRPRLPAVHGGVNAARERKRAGLAQVARRVERGLARRQAVRVVDRRQRDAGRGFEGVARVAHAVAISGTSPRTISFGPVLPWISSTDTPGARSRSTRPGRRHVDDGEVGDDPVHARPRRSAAACTRRRIFGVAVLGRRAPS